MEIRLVLTAFIVLSFRLIHGEPTNQEGHSKVQDNLRDLFDSINNNNARKTKDVRNILGREAAREQQVFDTVKEDLRLTRQRNAHKQKDIEHKMALKREAPKTPKGPEPPDASYDRVAHSSGTCATPAKKLPRPRSMGKRHPLSYTDDDHKLLNFSMVLPVNETTKTIVGNDFESQTTYLFEKIKHMVESSNATMHQVESIQICLLDLTYNYLVNNQIRNYFPYPYPGSTLWEVENLPMNATVAAKEVIVNIPLPTKGYNKNELRGRALDRQNSEYVYRLHEIPGRKP